MTSAAGSKIAPPTDCLCSKKVRTLIAISFLRCLIITRARKSILWEELWLGHRRTSLCSSPRLRRRVRAPGRAKTSQEREFRSLCVFSFKYFTARRVLCRRDVNHRPAHTQLLASAGMAPGVRMMVKRERRRKTKAKQSKTKKAVMMCIRWHPASQL